ncbi:type II secretion system protein [Geminisphaera colitermitum]|uniref:type II secretion system protein n=1 Tax=Geminisphaera colitermitum TaxID=1148786 RepID=UPI000158CBE7|nr:type II secretion system protein [Geminisphaera colitermitum]
MKHPTLSSPFFGDPPVETWNQTVPRRPRTDAFTLIELLAVITIIGVLAAIVIPVSAKVRQSARTAQCKSNLRQIGLAVILHANEQRNNTLPGPLYGKIAPAIKKNDANGRLGLYLASQFQTTLINNEVVMLPVLVCPGFAMARPDLIGVDESKNAIVYANNRDPLVPGYDGSVWGYPGSADPKNRPVPLHQISEPSRNWMIRDIDYTTGKGYGWPEDMMAPAPVHGNKYNRVYFDGHVASIRL